MAQKVKLISAERAALPVEKEALSASKYLFNELQRNPQQERISCETIGMQALQSVVSFLEHVHENPQNLALPSPLPSGDLSQVLPEWHARFVKEVETQSHDALFNLLAAANELEIESLEEIACAKVAASLQGKSAEEMRGYFGIESDFTQSEETEII